MARLEDFKPGDRVVITARSQDWAFVDGWRGTVAGYQSGTVVCRGPGMVSAGFQGSGDGVPEVTFLVPADLLTITV